MMRGFFYVQQHIHIVELYSVVQLSKECVYGFGDIIVFFFFDQGLDGVLVWGNAIVWDGGQCLGGIKTRVFFASIEQLNDGLRVDI